MRSTIFAAVIAMLSSIPVDSQLLIGYEPGREQETEVAHFLSNEGGFEAVIAELQSSTLTVRVSGSLTAYQVIEIAGLVADYYESASATRDSGSSIKELHILWEKRQEVDGLVFYEGGIAFEEYILNLFAKEADPSNVIRAFSGSVYSIVPEDQFEAEGDNARDSATESVREIHTISIDDTDWFKQRIRRSGKYVFETRSVAGQPYVDTQLDVIITDGYTKSDDDGGAGLYSRVEVCIERGQNVFARVSGFFRDEGYYELDVSRAEGNSCAPEGDEADNQGNSVPIGVGSKTLGSLHSKTDVDWFILEGLTQGGNYQISLDGADVEVSGILHPGPGESESAEGVRLKSGEGIDFKLTSSGPVYLEISGSGATEYTVELKDFELYEL
ncbi:MAG: hypothetical protein OXH96_10495 [Spirochaetaceae bacterium]|nr:hypothetical protein [Spirochaetaceae bacterium]